ncbi:hypothetical protein Tco_1389005 [Tanacetum coccineum]
MKQVDQYAQALSFIPVIEYIDQVDSSVRTILKEEVKTQLPQILPKAVLGFATLMTEQKVTESLAADVLARYSSQPTSTYEAAASLSEYELTKILLDKMEESKSHLRDDYKKELYDALTAKTKIKTPPLDQTEGRKEENKARKPSYPEIQEEPSHTFNDSRVQQDQEFDMRNNNEQPADKEVSKADWFKKPERPPTPDSDWNKRHHVDFRPPQTWISQVSHAKESQILVGPIFELLKGTYKSLTELEYHLEECSKAILKNSTGITLKASHPKGVIYKDLNNKNRLMRADELHKFSNGTLNDVQTALHDIAKGIRMEYLPKRKWSGLDKRRARVMIQDIEK